MMFKMEAILHIFTYSNGVYILRAFNAVCCMISIVRINIKRICQDFILCLPFAVGND